MVHADVEQVKQVFFNVIGNAVDAVPEGAEIRIVTGVDDEHVFIRWSIRVRESGRRIFQSL